MIGAMLFWVLFNFLTAFLDQVAWNGYLPESVLTTNQVGPLVFVLLGVGIILMLIFRPQGVLGDRREISLNVR